MYLVICTGFPPDGFCYYRVHRCPHCYTGDHGWDAAKYLAKAVESLETAKAEFANGRYKSCANRSYYACFQAAIAALLHEGMRASGSQWGHDYVQARFVGQLINRRKLYGGALPRVLSENQALRDRADYEPKPVSESQASRALAKAQTFVTAAQERSEAN